MISFSIRCCINCGSWSVKKNLFCEACSFLLIEKMRAPNAIQLQNFKVEALFLWQPGQSDSLSRLVLDLKSSNKNAWQYYAQKFLEIRRKFSSNSILISSLSLSGKKHAQNWGESLSHIAGIPHVVGLKICENKSVNLTQKELSKLARRNRQFENIAELSSQSRNIIFVDDVVTTGATALAAYRALGRPRNFQVWCLASRELSSIASH